MKPCKRNHTGPRYKSGQCIECCALRKGKERTLPPDRVAGTVRATKQLGKLAKEEIKLRNETARAERFRLKAQNDATAKAERQAETARFHVKKEAEREERRNPRLAIQVQAPVPAPAPLPPAPPPAPPPAARPEVLGKTILDGTGRPVFTPLLDREGRLIPVYRAAQAPKPAEPVVHVVPQTNLPEGMLPVWTREGRRPTRAELAAAHRRQQDGELPTYYGESVALVGPGVNPLAGNGVDLSDRPGGMRVGVYEDGRDAWREGGPNWTKRL